MWTVWSHYEDCYEDGSTYTSDLQLVKVFSNHETAVNFINSMTKHYHVYEMSDAAEDGWYIVRFRDEYDDGSYTRWFYQISSTQVDYDES